MSEPESIAPDLPAKGSRSLKRVTAIMASGTLVSRFLGFIKNAFLVAAIGVNAAGANSYDVANKIPNALFAVLAAGVLNAVLVPQIVRAFSREDGKRTVDRIVTLGLSISFAVAVAFTLGSGIAVRLYSQGWSDDQIALATAFGFWVIPQLFFYCAYTILGEVLNAREQFGPFMWSPAVNNVIGIVGLSVYIGIYGRYAVGVDESLAWDGGRIALLAGTATLGIAAQAGILLWPLLRGGYRPRWVWRGPKGELRTVRIVAAWALSAVLVEQVSVAYATRVASAANPGNIDPSIAGNAAYFNALMLYLVPHSLITVSIVTALMTSMSRMAARGDMTALRAEISRGIRAVAVFTFFAAAVLIATAPMLVRIALPTATPVVIVSVAQVLIALSVGLVPLGAMVFMKRVYFVLEDARAIFFIHIPMALTWIAVAWGAQRLWDPHWWTVGVALGLSASNLVAVVLRLRGLHRRLGGLDGRRVLGTHLKAFAAAVLAGLAGFGLSALLPGVADVAGWSGFFVAIGIVLGTAVVMLVVYGIALRVMRVDEVKDVVGPITRRFRRNVR